MSAAAPINGTELLAQQPNHLLSNTDIETDILEYDLGLLMASDISQLDGAQLYNAATREQYLHTLATQHCQLMVNHLFALPSTAVPNDIGRLVTLPTPLLQLPREKPVPQPKPATKWEQFARAKGIHKKGKRDRLVYDEQTDAYKPRFGYSKTDENEPVIIEHKESPNNTDETVDPWTRAEQEKAANRAKNNSKQQKNIEYHSAAGQRVPGTIDLGSAALNANLHNKKFVKQAGKHAGTHVDHALAAVQQSTASMGKFDKHVDNEPEQKRRNVKQDAVLTNAAAEKQHNLSVLQNLFGRETAEQKREQSLDVDKAVRQVKSNEDKTNRQNKFKNAQRGKGKGKGRK